MNFSIKRKSQLYAFHGNKMTLVILLSITYKTKSINLHLEKKNEKKMLSLQLIFLDSDSNTSKVLKKSK